MKRSIRSKTYNSNTNKLNDNIGLSVAVNKLDKALQDGDAYQNPDDSFTIGYRKQNQLSSQQQQSQQQQYMLESQYTKFSNTSQLKLQQKQQITRNRGFNSIQISGKQTTQLPSFYNSNNINNKQFNISQQNNGSRRPITQNNGNRSFNNVTRQMQSTFNVPYQNTSKIDYNFMSFNNQPQTQNYLTGLNSNSININDSTSIIQNTKNQTMKTFYSLRAQQRLIQNNKNRNIAASINISNIQNLNDEEYYDFLMKTEEIHSINVQVLLNLYEQKCKDNQIEYQPDQATKFLDKMKRQTVKRKLNLSDCQFGQYSAQVIAQLISMDEHFSHLNISRNNIGTLGAKILAQGISENNSLVHLDISGNNISTEGMQDILMALMQNQTIISLKIGSMEGRNRNRLGQQGSFILKHLIKQNQYIEFLDLSSTGLNQEVLEDKQFRTQKVNKLKKLCFQYIMEGFKIYNESIMINLFEEIKDINNKIDFSGFIHILQQMRGDGQSMYQITDEEIIKIKEVFDDKRKFDIIQFQNMFKIVKNQTINPCNITCINLANNDLGFEGGKYLEYFQGSNLKELNLQSNKLGNQSLIVIAKLLQGNNQLKLQSLNLNNNLLNSEGLYKFFQIVTKNKNLEQLYLDNNDFNGSGFKYITNFMEETSNLKVLSLRSCYIKDEYGDSIANGLKNSKNLETLNLSYNRLKDKGTQLFGIILKDASSLKNLELICCQIGDQSGMGIAEAMGICYCLENVNLKENNIHDVVGQQLVRSAKKNSNLQQVNIQRTPIGYKYTEDLENQLQLNQFQQIKQEIPGYIRNIQNMERLEREEIQKQRELEQNIQQKQARCQQVSVEQVEMYCEQEKQELEIKLNILQKEEQMCRQNLNEQDKIDVMITNQFNEDMKFLGINISSYKQQVDQCKNEIQYLNEKIKRFKNGKLNFYQTDEAKNKLRDTENELSFQKAKFQKIQQEMSLKEKSMQDTKKKVQVLEQLGDDDALWEQYFLKEEQELENSKIQNDNNGNKQNQQGQSKFTNQKHVLQRKNKNNNANNNNSNNKNNNNTGNNNKGNNNTSSNNNKGNNSSLKKKIVQK